MKQSLANIELLESVPQVDLAALAKRCRWRGYEEGEQVLGSSGRRHRCAVPHRRPAPGGALLGVGQGGRLRGPAPGTAFRGNRRDRPEGTASVFALEPSTVAFLSSKDFMNLMQAHFVIAQRVMRALCRLVRRLDERVFEFSTLTVSNRIHAELLRLAGGEAVTREMNVLARAGIIRQDREALHILDLPKLSQMVHEVLGLEPEEIA